MQRIGVEPGTHSRSEASQTSLTIRSHGGASVGTPCQPEEGMGKEEVLSLSTCLSIYPSSNNKLWAPFENKMRDIFLKRSVSFVHYHWLCSSLIIKIQLGIQHNIYHKFQCLDTHRKWLFSLIIVFKILLDGIKSYNFLERKFSEILKYWKFLKVFFSLIWYPNLGLVLCYN